MRRLVGILDRLNLELPRRSIPGIVEPDVHLGLEPGHIANRDSVRDLADFLLSSVEPAARQRFDDFRGPMLANGALWPGSMLPFASWRSESCMIWIQCRSSPALILAAGLGIPRARPNEVEFRGPAMDQAELGSGIFFLEVSREVLDGAVDHSFVEKPVRRSLDDDFLLPDARFAGREDLYNDPPATNSALLPSHQFKGPDDRKRDRARATEVK